MDNESACISEYGSPPCVVQEASGAANVSATPSKGKKGGKKRPDKTKARDARKLSIHCVMNQDNMGSIHKAGYTALLLDKRRGRLIAVTSDHNLLHLAPSSPTSITGMGKTRAIGSLVTKRQIVGYNDEVIDIKSIPDGVLSGQVGDEAEGDKNAAKDAQSWLAVATNSPQVRRAARYWSVPSMRMGESCTVL